MTQEKEETFSQHIARVVYQRIAEVESGSCVPPKVEKDNKTMTKEELDEWFEGEGKQDTTHLGC